MKFFQNRKAVLLTIALAVTILVGVGGTLAFLTDKTDEVQNTFTPTKVDIEITETFANNVKSNVCVQNVEAKENINAYIRAMIVVTWQNEDGQVLAPAPVLGTDYTMTLGTDGWSDKQNDNYYYYASSVAPKDSTEPLIVSAEPLKACSDTSYTLHIEIIAEAIQAEPSDVVATVWPKKPN